MACDTGVFSGGRICGHTRKWAAVPEHKGGGFVASAGNLGEAQDFIRAMSSDRTDSLPEAEAAIWLRGDGVVLERYGDGEWMQYDAPFYVIGSGESVAHGALMAGASAAEAVRICTEVCTECAGGPEIAGDG